MGDFTDKTITCIGDGCGKEFIHSAEDQQRFQDLGYTNEPKRCFECRQARKQSQGGGGGGVPIPETQ